jgi:hypothetical protein
VPYGGLDSTATQTSSVGVCASPHLEGRTLRDLGNQFGREGGGPGVVARGGVSRTAPKKHGERPDVAQAVA